MFATQIVQALPILLLILVGVLVRVSGLVARESRVVVTRLVYYVTIPAAIVTSIAQAEMTGEAVLLTLIGFGLPCLLAGLIYLITPDLATRPGQRGVLLAAMVVLAVFAYPFFELYYGVEGLARIALFDVGNALYAGTVALWLAQAHGTNGNGRLVLNWRRVLTSPLLLAAVAGILASLFHVELTGPLGGMLGLLKAANTPLAMIAVGMYLEPRASHGSLIARYIGVRMVLGGLLGWGASLVLGLRGLDLVAATVGSALPAGTTALMYAGAEGLDAEFAASLISATLLVGVVVISVLPALLGGVYL